MNNIMSNTAIVNVLTFESSIEFDYKHNRIEPLILGRSCLYTEIKILTCCVPSLLVYTLNVLNFIINDRFDQIPETAKQVCHKMLQHTTLFNCS